MTSLGLPALEEGDEDEFEVSAITSSDGTRVKPAAPPPTAADLLGVGAYAVSNSDSSDESASDEDDDEEGRPRPAEVTNGAGPEPSNGRLPAKRNVEDDLAPSSKRKRVRFAVEDEESALNEAPVVDPIVSGASAEDEAELEATLAAFEAEVGEAGEDLDERDVDLAEAEDAREEALQENLRRRVEQMRARLKGGKHKDTGTEGTRLTIGGEDISLKMRPGKREKVNEEEESDSGGEIDLMRDWTEFVE